VSLSQATPIARTDQRVQVFVLPVDSPLKTMKDRSSSSSRPGSVKWGGGSRGSTEHIAAAMIAREVGVDPAKINYVAFRGGGRSDRGHPGGNVTVGGSGYSEFAEYINHRQDARDRRHLRQAPQGYRGAHAEGAGHQRRDRQLARACIGAAGITPDQRKALIDMVVKATKTKYWTEQLDKNGWTPAVLTGAEFEKFVDDEFASLRAVMAKSGMIDMSAAPAAPGKRISRGGIDAVSGGEGLT